MQHMVLLDIYPGRLPKLYVSEHYKPPAPPPRKDIYAHGHGSYVGPDERFKGCTALLQIERGPAGRTYAQFDRCNQQPELMLGWHAFPREHFKLDEAREEDPTIEAVRRHCPKTYALTQEQRAIETP